MFVAQSTFTVENDMIEEVKAAFRRRPRLVDQTPGFVRMDVISPVATPAQIVLLTYWLDEQSFRLWHQSQQFQDSHQGMPKGLKLDLTKTAMEFHHFITS